MMQCIDVNGNASLPIECGNDFKIGSKMKFSFDMKTMDIGKIIIWQVLDSTGNDIQNTWHLDSIQLVDNSYISLDGIHVSTLQSFNFLTHFFRKNIISSKRTNG